MWGQISKYGANYFGKFFGREFHFMDNKIIILYLQANAMFDIQKPIPSYLIEKTNIVRLILFTAAFALIFINIYAPFGVKYWFNVTKWELLAYSSIITLTGVLVVVVSRLMMFKVCKRKRIAVWHYLLWSIAEIFFMALFYALSEKFILNDQIFFPDILKASIQNTALVIILPYSTLWLYFSWREKKEQLEYLSQQPIPNDSNKNMIAFHDEKGGLRISVKTENLLYLEAADNYVNIFYLNKEKVFRFMLRNTLKQLEEKFKNTEVIRCHRSFMVNFDKIKVIKKEKDGLQLEFDVPMVSNIPVSKSYLENVLNTFSKYVPTNQK
jgi:hypothetical protein